MSTAGPPPTISLNFSELHQAPLGQKVRFLGCVTNYSTTSGEVTLHNKTLPSRNKKALIDVNLLLETLKTPETRIGEWVNIIGYVTKQESKESTDRTPSSFATSIQAIVYWSSGALKPDEYEDAVAESQNSHLTM